MNENVISCSDSVEEGMLCKLTLNHVLWPEDTSRHYSDASFTHSVGGAKVGKSYGCHDSHTSEERLTAELVRSVSWIERYRTA